MEIFSTKYKNNLSLVAENLPSLKTVSIGFFFSVGSRYEDETCGGITHFCEHLLFKGTKNKSAYEISCDFDKIGGYANAWTDRENLCLFCVVPAQFATEAAKTMIDMIENSQFDEKEIEKERTVIENEILLSADDPEEAASDGFFSALWGNSSLGRLIAGDVSEVKKISVNELKAWYEERIQKAPFLISVAGNTDFLDFSLFENLSPRQNREKDFFPALWHEGSFKKKAKTAQNQIFCAIPLAMDIYEPSKLEEQLRSAQILNAIIGDSMSSRLFQALRENSGLCYNVSSQISLFEDVIMWSCYAGYDKKNARKVLDIIKAELKAFTPESLTEREFSAAMAHVIGEETILSDESESAMKRLARRHLLKLPPISYDDELKIISKTDFLSVKAALESLPERGKFTVFEYGP
ncbi:MAG: insulinase family protein [Spirochaetaceae bacterium]|nr:insulinase family protein [Spirochaetaceae bacterium]